MAIYLRENNRLGAEEQMIALRIILVIYLHDKRYSDALREIEGLLDDPEMQEWREELLSKQNEVREALAISLNKKKPVFLQFILDLFHDPA